MNRKNLLNRTKESFSEYPHISSSLFFKKTQELEPVLGEAEHNRVFARHERMTGRARQVRLSSMVL